MNIEWLKCAIKSEEQICKYHSILTRLLDIARLLGCIWLLSLRDVAFDDVLGQWHNTNICHALLQTLDFRE